MQDLPYKVELCSQWTQAKSGGALGTKDAVSNPQIAVAVPAGGATIQISVLTVRTCAVCFILVPVSSFGQALTKPIGRPIIDTGHYRHGFVASDRQHLAHGSYALLVTNFEAGKLAKFEARVMSSAKLKVVEIR
jgi:hypothetical protein